jgi:hypothetical protein
MYAENSVMLGKHSALDSSMGAWNYGWCTPVYCRACWSRPWRGYTDAVQPRVGSSRAEMGIGR